MNYEWDEAKSSADLEKHGLSFEVAETVFEGDTITVKDCRQDYGEPRYATLGSLQGRVVFIAHTTRAENVRIISMRKANEREQKIYQERLAAHRQDE
ncbi:BrnT family toxin [bacterium]|nr:BrnT family toxin [bacterium]